MNFVPNFLLFLPFFSFFEQKHWKRRAYTKQYAVYNDKFSLEPAGFELGSSNPKLTALPSELTRRYKEMLRRGSMNTVYKQKVYHWTNKLMCIERIKATWCHKHKTKNFLSTWMGLREHCEMLCCCFIITFLYKLF